MGDASERGAALLVAVLVMIMVMAIAATILASTTTEFRAVAESGERLQAYYIAEAGFDATLTVIKNSSSINSASDALNAAARTWAFGGGSVTTTAALRGDLLLITATAVYGRATRVVSACIDVGFDIPVTFRYAAASGGQMQIRSNAVVDSFRSSDGAVPATLLTNPPTTLGGQRGDAYGGEILDTSSTSYHRGYGYLPSNFDSSLVQGSLGVVRVGSPLALRRIRRPPSVAAPSAAKVVNSWLPNPPLTGTLAFTNMSVQDGRTLQINGPATVVVNGDVTIEDGSTIAINTSGGRVAFYIGDDLDMNSSGRFTTSSTVPSAFNIWMYGTDGETISIRGPGFYGTLYHGGSMNAGERVRIRAGAGIYGACAIRNEELEVLGSGRVIYDEDLAGLAIPASTLPTFEVTGWRSAP